MTSNRDAEKTDRYRDRHRNRETIRDSHLFSSDVLFRLIQNRNIR